MYDVSDFEQSQASFSTCSMLGSRRMEIHHQLFSSIRQKRLCCFLIGWSWGWFDHQWCDWLTPVHVVFVSDAVVVTFLCCCADLPLPTS